MPEERVEEVELDTYIPMNMNDVAPAFAQVGAGVFVMRVDSVKLILAKKDPRNPMAVYQLIPVYEQGGEPGKKIVGRYTERFVLATRKSKEEPLEEAVPNEVGRSFMRTFTDNCGITEYPTDGNWDLKIPVGMFIGMRIIEEKDDEDRINANCVASFLAEKVEGYVAAAA